MEAGQFPLGALESLGTQAPHGIYWVLIEDNLAASGVASWRDGSWFGPQENGPAPSAQAGWQERGGGVCPAVLGHCLCDTAKRSLGEQEVVSPRC